MTVLNWNDTKIFSLQNYKVEIIAIPAIHGINPVSALLAGKVNGYFIKITNEYEIKTIYITSDTVYKEKKILSLKNRHIDLLIPNMGAAKQGSWIMTLTLNSNMLKKIIDKLNPEIVIPIHYGTFRHYKEPVEKIKELNDKRIKILEVGSRINLA